MTERDESGNILPAIHSCKIKGKDVDIKLVPLCRGEIKRLEHGTLDEDLILKKLISPGYSDIELELLKPGYRTELIKIILEFSGVTFSNNKKSKQLEVKDDWAKEVMRKAHKKQDRKLLLFLHKHGYNFFNLNKLTITEIDDLVVAFNEEQPKESSGSKGKKGKRR